MWEKHVGNEAVKGLRPGPQDHAALFIRPGKSHFIALISASFFNGQTTQIGKGYGLNAYVCSKFIC